MKTESSWSAGRLLLAIMLFASVSATSAYLVIRWHYPQAAPFSLSEASPQTLGGLENAFGGVAQRLESSVVTVAVRGKPRSFSFPPFGLPSPRLPRPPQSEEDPPGMGRTPRGGLSPDSTPPPLQMTGLGSGLIVRTDGYILTNAHVVREAEKVEVTLYDGAIFEAKIVGQDRRGDVAVLKVNAKQKLPAAALGDSDKVKVGQWAIAVGNPVNLKGTVSVGVVSGLNRSLGNISGLIQTDVAITSGSSGGPLCNLRGEVIGINTMITREAVGMGIPFEGGVTGYGFAIPINAAKRAMEDLIAQGKVSYGYVGVMLEPLSAAQAEAAKVKKGVSIRSVTKGSPGDKAGLVVGDIVTHVDGKEVSSPAETQHEIRQHRAGEKVKLTVVRGKKPQQVAVQLGELPEQNALSLPRLEEPKPEAKPDKPLTDAERKALERALEEAQRQRREESERKKEEPSTPPTPKPDFKLHEWRGITVQELDDEAREYLKLPKGETGVLVAGVMQDSPAYKAGLDASDVIQEIDGQKVKTVRDFERITKSLDTKKSIRITVKRQDEKRTVTVAP